MFNFIKEENKNDSRKRNVLLFFFVVVVVGVFVFPQVTHAQGFFDLVKCAASPNSCTTEVLSAIGDLILSLAGFVLFLAGTMLNYAIWISVVNMSTVVDSIGTITIAWQVLRDMANMAFIFILLYISIATILRLDGYGARALLTKVIIAALLINFSLFLTKAVIDASNILAVEFHDGISELNKKDSGEEKSLSAFFDSGVSGAIMEELELTTIYKTVEEGGVPTVGQFAIGTVLKGRNIFIVTLLGAIFVLITAFIFFAGAILLIMRLVVLIILMIISPLAFIGMILPKTAGYANKWWDKLFQQAFFAPIFLALIYVVVLVIKDDAIKKSLVKATDVSNIGAAGSTYFFGAPIIILNFFIISAMMIAAIIIASRLGAHGSKALISFGKASLGKGTLGGAAALGRNTIGRAASGIASSGAMRNLAARNRMAAITQKGLQGVAGASFNVASIPGVKVPGLAKGAGKGGYTKKLEEQVKKEVKFAQSVGGPSPETRTELKNARVELGNAVNKPGIQAARREIAVAERDLKEAENRAKVARTKNEIDQAQTDINRFTSDLGGAKQRNESILAEYEAAKARMKAVEDKRDDEIKAQKEQYAAQLGTERVLGTLFTKTPRKYKEAAEKIRKGQSPRDKIADAAIKLAKEEAESEEKKDEGGEDKKE